MNAVLEIKVDLLILQYSDDALVRLRWLWVMERGCGCDWLVQLNVTFINVLLLHRGNVSCLNRRGNNWISSRG